jgi:transcription initiation factor TFIIIB Brf1 subunit/transcription initiation factor TFIIB
MNPQIQRKPNTFANAAILKLICTSLSDKQLTQTELIEITGLTNSTVSKWLALFHRAPNCVYIADWRRTGERGNWSAVWAWGYKEFDKPKPKPLTSAEYNKRWRAKKAKERKITLTEKGTIYESN